MSSSSNSKLLEFCEERHFEAETNGRNLKCSKTNNFSDTKCHHHPMLHARIVAIVVCNTMSLNFFETSSNTLNQIQMPEIPNIKQETIVSD